MSYRIGIGCLILLLCATSRGEAQSQAASQAQLSESSGAEPSLKTNPMDALEITLQPGEIVYVAQSGFSRVGVVLQKLSPLMTLTTMAIVKATRW